MLFHSIIAVLFSVLFVSSPRLENGSGGFKNPAFFHESIVWPVNVDKHHGIQWHFVYGLAEANDQSILCFAEGRIGKKDDEPHHIVLRRSIDKGKNWQATQIVVDSKEGESFANPTPVVERKSGKIFLFYAKNLHNNRSELYFVSSSDHGLTWTEPTELTSLFDSDPIGRPFHLPGPGHGIQLKNGRLLLQVWHRFPVNLTVDKRQYGVSIIYSDDRGATWESGGFVPQHTGFPANESRLVELKDGTVLLDARYATSGIHSRIQYTSNDQGLTWSPPSFGTLPAFTAVDASLNILKSKGNTLLMATRPADTTGRRDLTISISEDEGMTWPYSKLIFAGAADYSDAIQLSDGSIFVLYGRGNPRYVASANFNLAWVRE